MNSNAKIQGAVEDRELTSGELDQVTAAFGWFDLLEGACLLSPVCAAGYVGHMLFAE